MNVEELCQDRGQPGFLAQSQKQYVFFFYVKYLVVSCVWDNYSMFNNRDSLVRFKMLNYWTRTFN